MNSNTVVQEAVDELNAQKREQVLKEAVRLAECIEKERAKVEAGNQRIAALRAEAIKLVKSEVTAESVLGIPLPANANHDTVAAVIEKANKDRQYGIEQQAIRFRDSILAEQDAIVLIEKRIAELREALVKLTVPVVSVTQITG